MLTSWPSHHWEALFGHHFPFTDTLVHKLCIVLDCFYICCEYSWSTKDEYWGILLTFPPAPPSPELYPKFTFTQKKYQNIINRLQGNEHLEHFHLPMFFILNTPWVFFCVMFVHSTHLYCGSGLKAPIARLQALVFVYHALHTHFNCQVISGKCSAKHVYSAKDGNEWKQKECGGLML